MDNANSREYLEKIRVQVIENLRRSASAPSVQMTDVPRDIEGLDEEAEAMMDDLDEDENADRRHTQRSRDRYIRKDNEFSDSEDDEMDEANGIRRQSGKLKRKNRMDYRNLTEFGDSGVESGVASPMGGSSVPDEDGDVPIEDADAANADGAETPSPADMEDNVESAAVSNGHSPLAAAEDEDVTMEDDNPAEPVVTEAAPVSNSIQVTTPPDSPPNPPPAAAAPAAAPSTTSDAAPAPSATENTDEPPIKEEASVAGDEAAAAAEAHAEGFEEREKKDVAAEAATEAAQKSES